MVHWYPNFDPYHAIVFWTVRFCLAIVADEHVGQPRAQSPSNGGDGHHALKYCHHGLNYLGPGLCSKRVRQICVERHLHYGLLSFRQLRKIQDKFLGFWAQRSELVDDHAVLFMLRIATKRTT